MSDFIWVEKYRPKTIEECILPESTKKTFQDFLDKGEIPNMLLAGPPGIGKTTVAKALCNELGADVYVINGSCLLYTSPSPRDATLSRMPSSA